MKKFKPKQFWSKAEKVEKFEPEVFWMLLDLGCKGHGSKNFYFILSCHCERFNMEMKRYQFVV